ncbi:hypothetical protein OG407_05265 [Streptomyces sp. NBC_01515]|uniref:hypothetical protein n=1 Tax=Streptomyces sp. NBC_01515 TaxID=2903890 RepID=UPI0038656FF5
MSIANGAQRHDVIMMMESTGCSLSRFTRGSSTFLMAPHDVSSPKAARRVSGPAKPF